MKITKIITLIATAIILLSCGANPTKKMAKVLDKVYIGMPEKEFKEAVDKEELIEANAQITIYRVLIKTYNDARVLTAGTGWRQDLRFFYFQNNKLMSIDKGERAVDYRIKID